MHRHALRILLAVGVALIALLYVTGVDFNGTGADKLYPDLQASLNDIDKITVTAGGGRAVATLERSDERWVVAEKSGYPADVGKIRRNLIALADAVVVEEKTSNPALYDRLGVEDIDAADAGGVLLEISGPAPVSLIVGDAGIRGDMAYVRKAGDAQSLLVSADLDVASQTIDWVARDIIDIPTRDIARIEIRHADGELLQLEKATRDQADFSVIGIPAGAELNYPSVANPIGGALASLELDDVRPAATSTLPDASATADFSTFDGLLVSVAVYETDDGRLVSFSVGASEALAAQYLLQDDSRAATAGNDPAMPAEDPEAIIEKAARRVDELNAKLGPWLYALPSFKAEQLVKRMDDLLKSTD